MLKADRRASQKTAIGKHMGSMARKIRFPPHWQQPVWPDGLGAAAARRPNRSQQPAAALRWRRLDISIGAVD